jgi:hypothetical protein
MFEFVNWICKECEKAPETHRKNTLRKGYYESTFNADFKSQWEEIMTEVEGENEQLEEMKVIFEYWLDDSAKYVGETNHDDYNPPTLNLENFSTKTTVHIRREHMVWFGDALAVQFAHLKNDPHLCQPQQLDHLPDKFPFNVFADLSRDIH